MKNQKIEKAYSAAREVYANLGVDTDKVLEILRQISISLHCWQADDVGGFEKPDAALSGVVFRPQAITRAKPGTLMN
jgi:L-rhamnose isomerase